MRFPLLVLATALVAFAGGYALVEPPLPKPAEVAKAPVQVERRPVAPAERVELFQAFAPQGDPLTQGHQILTAIEALEMEELRALFDPARAEDLRRRLREVPNDLKNPVLENLVRRWMEIDEAGVLAWLPNLTRCFPADRGGSHPILNAIAERDAEAAIDFTKQMSAGGFRDSLAHSLLEELAKSNPARARALLARFDEDPKLREAAESGYRRGLLASNPAAQIAALNATPESERKTNAHSIISGMAEQTPTAIRELCRVLEKPTDRAFALRRLAESDPPSAARVAEELLANFPNEPVRARESYLVDAAFSWGRSNEEQATAWALPLPEELRTFALGRVAAGLGELNPKAEAQYLEKLVRGEAQEVLASSSVETRAAIFSQWLMADAARAQAWADALPPGEVRTAVQAQLLSRLAMQGRGEEVFRRAAALPAAEARRVALTAAQWMVHRDGQRAAEAAVEFGRSSQEHEPLELAVEHWFLNDSASAAAWVEQLPSGPARDAAAAGCARMAVGLDADAAIAWVAQIGDAGLRSQAAELIAKEWKKRDARAADAWLASLSAK